MIQATGNNRSASDRLKEHSQKVLELFVEAVRINIFEARKESGPILTNSLPLLLKYMQEQLLTQSNEVSNLKIEDAARDHAEQRVRLTNYSLSNVLTEYHLLRKILFEVLREEGPLTFTDSDIINYVIDRGGAHAGQHYMELSAAKLKQSQKGTKELYEFFMQAPIPLVILLGPNHYFTLANPPYEKLIGRKATGKNLLEIFSEEEVKQYIPLLDGVYQTGIPHIGNELALNITGDDGNLKELWINIGYYPFKEDDGTIKGILAFVQDVTILVLARKAVESSERRFRELANSLPQMIYSSSPEGKLLWYNDVWYEYTGITRDLTGEESWVEAVHPDDLEATKKEWYGCMRLKKKYCLEIRMRKGNTNEYRWHLSLALPIFNLEGEVERWIGSLTDIQDQKDIVKDLVQEREMRERFVSALSHDLRTPLAAAKMAAQVLSKKVSNDPLFMKTALRISDNMDRADGMIRDLLDASFIKAGKKLPLKIDHCVMNNLIQETIDELTTIHGDRFRFLCDVIVEGYWDYKGVQRVIENLCTNAIKYGLKGATITISLEMKDAKVFVGVHNEGNPIPPLELKSMFDAFQRSDSALIGDEIGWGIGLALAKGLSEAHGGNVFLTSSQDHGTLFTVTLPIDSRDQK